MRQFLIISVLSILVLSCNTSKTTIVNNKGKKINMQTVKGMEYLKLSNKINCDSIETTLGLLVCANIELQKQDSILKKMEVQIINEFNERKDSLSLSRFIHTTNLWEEYRYSHCMECTIDNQRIDRIQFLECAIELTKNRIYILKTKCNDY